MSDRWSELRSGTTSRPTIGDGAHLTQDGEVEQWSLIYVLVNW